MITAAENGVAQKEYTDGLMVGPGLKNCKRWSLKDADTDPIIGIILWVNEVVKGITIKKATTTGNFGTTDLRDSTEWFFDAENPLIGIYGNN